MTSITKTLRVLVNLEHHLIIFVQANLFRLAHDLFLDFNEAISLSIKLHGSGVDRIFLINLPLSNAFFLCFPDDLLLRLLRFLTLLALLFRFLYLWLLDQLPVSCDMAEPAFFTKFTLPSFCEVPAAAFVVLFELLLLFRVPVQLCLLHPCFVRSLQRPFLSFV